MKKMFAACAVALVLLAGCGEPGGDDAVESKDGITEVRRKISDGRTVTCLIWSGARKGGLSCDWANAK